ncbi:rap GTPase-activating protein, putative [Entamoeba invadens IP1]|uniref:Rap GTPase-activating protein, putative n=1 Tax=Entamoeba invadens IP1 TaxID=370355 RepID=A0A0A1UEC2_ENTIV|nr:rap GTPase-activating protein, putative [Entamoeba invadens IP1]ELP94941.1 rap GTPase-activating protein, putative [Entamoeba invadens IP1]|eukprot:XP_004261712.1 rap GTPase-activating protein, putative [Entamoeba invadens IP1]
MSSDEGGKKKILFSKGFRVFGGDSRRSSDYQELVTKKDEKKGKKRHASISTEAPSTQPPPPKLVVKSKNTDQKAIEEKENLDMLNLFKSCISKFATPSPLVFPCPSLTKYKTLNKSTIQQKEDMFEMCGNAIYRITVKIDCWSSLVLETDEFCETQESQLIPLSVQKSGYNLESNSASIKRKSNFESTIIVDVESDFPFYKQFFYKNLKVHHYLSKEEHVLVSIEKFNEVSRCIYRGPKGVVRCLIGKDESEKPQNYARFFSDPKSVTCIANDSGIDDKLCEMEEMATVSHYKFGVIYVKPGQTTEDQIFSNTESDCSPAFWNFLNLIGAKIELSKYSGYRGGLDVKTGSTGKYSYTSHTNTYDIMFHVAPLLPTLKGDEQGLEKKRHVGNDIVVLVFKERNAPKDMFDPQIITSHMSSVFVVVSPHNMKADNDMYTVGIASNAEIGTFPPYLNKNGLYKHDKNLKDFILRKMINAERSAMLTGTYRLNARKALKDQIDSIGKTFCK